MTANLGTLSDDLPDEQVQPLLDALTGLTGITIAIRKKTMVMFRLRKRFAELEHPGLSQYLHKLRTDRREQQIFINLLTTNETSFFRTRRVWEFLEQTLLPEFHAAEATAPFKAWSAAASTGEEACSIAMSCLDFQLSHPAFRFQILATDIDTEVLAQARSGTFRATTVERLKEAKPTVFKRFFAPTAAGAYQLDAATLRAIRFDIHNLMSSPRAFMPQDAVFLRNVLIYFRESEQSKIVRGIADCMRVGSILILGESESLSSIDAPFQFLHPQIYRRIA